MLLEQKAIQTLRDTRKTLAVAESCTGGLLCHRLTNIPGSSEVLKFGLVAYADEAKLNFLNVPETTLRRYGAVSKETAIAMAKGVRNKLGTDLGISITGIAGPGGGSAKKPIGTTFMAINSGARTSSFKFNFKGSRKSIKSQAATKALRLIIKAVYA